ncbi:MAG: hypothetical protein AAB320_06330 [Elusimicrobiota bacterium]
MGRLLAAVLLLMSAAAAQAGPEAQGPQDPAAYDKQLKDAAGLFETAQPLAAKAPGMVAAIGKTDPAKAAELEKLLSETDKFQQDVLAGKVPELALDAKILAAAKKIKADGPKAVAAYRLALAPKGFAPSAAGGAPGTAGRPGAEPVNEAALVSRLDRSRSAATFASAQRLAGGLDAGRSSEDLPGFSQATNASFPSGTNRTATANASYLPRSNTRSTDLGLSVPAMSIPPAARGQAPAAQPGAPPGKPGGYRGAIQGYRDSMGRVADGIQDSGVAHMQRAMDETQPWYKRAYNYGAAGTIALGEGLVRTAGLEEKAVKTFGTAVAVAAVTIVVAAAAIPAAAAVVAGAGVMTTAAVIGGVTTAGKAAVLYMTLAHGIPAAQQMIVNPTVGNGIILAANVAPVPGAHALGKGAVIVAEKLAMRAAAAEAKVIVSVATHVGADMGKAELGHITGDSINTALGSPGHATVSPVMPATARPH